MQLEWGGPADDDLIDMAFSKKRSADRREWMREATRREQVASETGSERSALGAQRLPQRRSYKDFVQDELVHFSLADVRRHLPSRKESARSFSLSPSPSPSPGTPLAALGD